MVPTTRSHMAFARGARTGVLMILVPSAAKTASKEAVNLASRCVPISSGTVPEGGFQMT